MARLNVRRYVEGRRDLWYTVINERPITLDWVEAALAGLEVLQPSATAPPVTRALPIAPIDACRALRHFHCTYECRCSPLLSPPIRRSLFLVTGFLPERPGLLSAQGAVAPPTETCLPRWRTP